MNKRIVLLTIILIVTFGISICNAESWQQVDNKIWVDIDSIQSEYNGITKATAREYIQDNSYYILKIHIDEHNKTYCYEQIDLYNINGIQLGVTSVDTKDNTSWIKYMDNDKLIQEIIRRTAGR